MRRTPLKSKTGFKPPSPEKLRQKQEEKRRRTQNRNTNKKRVRVANLPDKAKSKLPTVKTMRNKCDKLLTPIIKAQHPYCFLRIADQCAGYTEVAHHHIKKSQSTAVRYDLDNLIPLCHRCHMKLHGQETTWASLIVEKKGIKWWKQLYAKSVHMVKADVHFYIENYERLNKILESDKMD